MSNYLNHLTKKKKLSTAKRKNSAAQQQSKKTNSLSSSLNKKFETLVGSGFNKEPALSSKQQPRSMSSNPQASSRTNTNPSNQALSLYERASQLLDRSIAQDPAKASESRLEYENDGAFGKRGGAGGSGSFARMMDARADREYSRYVNDFDRNTRRKLLLSYMDNQGALNTQSLQNKGALDVQQLSNSGKMNVQNLSNEGLFNRSKMNNLTSLALQGLAGKQAFDLAQFNDYAGQRRDGIKSKMGMLTDLVSSNIEAGKEFSMPALRFEVSNTYDNFLYPRKMSPLSGEQQANISSIDKQIGNLENIIKSGRDSFLNLREATKPPMSWTDWVENPLAAGISHAIKGAGGYWPTMGQIRSGEHKKYVENLNSMKNKLGPSTKKIKAHIDSLRERKESIYDQHSARNKQELDERKNAPQKRIDKTNEAYDELYSRLYEKISSM